MSLTVHVYFHIFTKGFSGQRQFHQLQTYKSVEQGLSTTLHPLEDSWLSLESCNSKSWTFDCAICDKYDNVSDDKKIQYQLDNGTQQAENPIETNFQQSMIYQI